MGDQLKSYGKYADASNTTLLQQQENRLSGCVQGQGPATEAGICSALNELMDVTGSIVGNAASLTACFGLSCPSESGKPADSMVQRLLAVTRLLRSANADIVRTITHINS